MTNTQRAVNKLKRLGEKLLELLYVPIAWFIGICFSAIAIFWTAGGSSPIRSLIAGWFEIPQIRKLDTTKLSPESAADFKRLAQHIADLQIDAASTVIFAIVTFSFAMIGYNKGLSLRTGLKLDELESQNSNLVSRVAQIQDHIDNPNQRLEKIPVGLFAKLLAYSPLYVADKLGYFRDEGVEIEVSNAGGDFAVANGIRKGDFLFGICDPIFTLQRFSEKAERLKILIPVTKRIDISVACIEGVLELENIRILTFPQPSTTYAAALELKWQLSKLSHVKKIELVEVSPDESAFKDPQNMSELLNQADIFLLWNPATAWLINHHNSDNKYRRLVRNKNVTLLENPDHWSLTNFDDPLDIGQHKLWRPHNHRDGQHKLLGSAILVSEATIEHRPELCRKVFKAISRALLRMESDGWQAMKGGNLSLGGAIRSCVDNDEDIDNALIERLIRDPNSPESPSLFPYIEGVSCYDPSKYTVHLKNTYRLWSKDEDFSRGLNNPGAAASGFQQYFYDANHSK